MRTDRDSSAAGQATIRRGSLDLMGLTVSS